MGINDNSFSIVNPAQDEAPDGIPKYNDAKYPIELELLTAHTGCTVPLSIVILPNVRAHNCQ